MRDTVPRASQAGWKAREGRRDPVEILLETNEGRLENLIPIRLGRMSASPFAFYRGAAAIMAADLAQTPRVGLRVQACGDAHPMNFDAFATPERNVIFDINDLDETLPARSTSGTTRSRGSTGACARTRWPAPTPATRRPSPAIWAPDAPSTTRSASSRSTTRTRRDAHRGQGAAAEGGRAPDSTPAAVVDGKGTGCAERRRVG